MCDSVIPAVVVPRGLLTLREVVLAGPGVPVAADLGAVALRSASVAVGVEAAVGAVAPADARRQSLSTVVSVVAILGLCLFSGEGYSTVLTRLWPLLSRFNPALLMRGPVTSPGLSKARTRVPPAVMRAVFEAGAAREIPEPGYGQRVFGFLVTGTDGTVLDLGASEANQKRYATPSGGTFPQARVVTLVACGTRRILGAEIDSCAVSEQVLWDRLAGRLRPGTLNLADRNFFSMNRWRIASATGAQLIWRVKNGQQSVPARILQVLADGSCLVRLRESNAMLYARRKAIGDPKAARLDDITVRMVEFMVTVTDQSGRSTRSRFRVMTTLLDPLAYPAGEIAACYAERWQVEITYKLIKSGLRGGDRQLRGQTPDLAEQEIWGLLAVYNLLVEHAVATAVELGIDPDEISFIHVLRVLRDHLIPVPACHDCGAPARLRPAEDLIAAIASGPRNRPDRDRTAPRTAKGRQTQHTRNVRYTIDILESNLPKTT